MARPLPPVPSLEQYRKQARDLLKAFRAGDAQTVERMRRHHPVLAREGDASAVRLSDAQWAIAREYGFASWPRFKRHVEAAAASADRCRPFVKEIDYYDGRAFGLHSVFQTGQQRALQLIQQYHPRFADASDEQIRQAEFSMDDARLVTAREHGLDTWDALARRVEALAAGEAEEPFLLAYEAIRDGDLDRLKALLRRDRALVNAKGTNGNRLLTLATSMGTVDAVRLLLRAGADVDLPNNKGWTPLHAAAYADPKWHDGRCLEILDILLDAGASAELEAYGDGGTPLMVALFWGHRPQSEILGERGVVPNNLRVAAALGRLDLVRACFHPDGSLKPHAGEHREFHRPHSGFPPWRPSNDTQEILDEAFVWACRNGQTGVLGYLLERGANIDADPYRGTGLFWAATNGLLPTVRWLLDHGADVNRRATWGGPQHGQGIVALHLAAQNGHLPMVKYLVEHGSDTHVEDEIYRSTPQGWAAHRGHAEVGAYLASAAGNA